MFGTATDDAHHYFDARTVGARGDAVFPGDLGFVMVRAAKEPAAIRAAIARGDFYASTGVLLARVERTGDRLGIDVDERSPGVHRFTFVGAGGRALSRAQGRRAAFALAGRARRLCAGGRRGRRRSARLDTADSRSLGARFASLAGAVARVVTRHVSVREDTRSPRLSPLVYV